MLSAHTVAQVRFAEQALLEALPPGALMARAATGLAVVVADELRTRRGGTYGARVLLVVGAGDNGGDALFAGAWLARRGVAVRAVRVADRVHDAGLAALVAAGGREVDMAAAVRFGADLVVDGVVGIGGSPGLRPAAVETFGALRGIPVLAVDLPSGVDVDTGETPAEHVRADVTVTLGTHKVANLLGPASAACGVLRLVDLGLDLPPARVEALEAADVAGLLPVPGGVDHKYTRGVVGVRAGSATYPGAALLCVAGASAGFAGMVRYVGPVADRVRVQHPEAVGAGRVQAWAVGSGGYDEAQASLAAALADGVPVVVDADALLHLPVHLPTGPGHDVVLTPHAGELSAMVGVPRERIEAAPMEYAVAAAEQYGAVVLLKGARTVIADPHGRVRVNTTGTGWLATAGAGDVLAGLLASLLASGLGAFDAASVAAWLHGSAGEVAAGDPSGPIVAGDVARAVPAVVRALPSRRDVIVSGRSGGHS